MGEMTKVQRAFRPLAGVVAFLLVVSASQSTARGERGEVYVASTVPAPTARDASPDPALAGEAEAGADGDDAARESAVQSGEPTFIGQMNDERKQYTGPKGDQVFFEAYWDRGIKYRLLGRLKVLEDGHLVGPYLSRDPLVVGELGVKLHVDAAAYVEGDDLVQLDDKVDVRRSFLIVRGRFFNFVYPVDFSIEMGAIRTSFFINQGYLQLTDLPYVGSVRVGQYTAPQSFESKMNSRDIGLMEAASPVQAFSAGILAGVQISDHYVAPAMTWAIGLFTDGQDGEVGDASEDFARVVGRVTWVPWQTREGEDPALLHLGMGISYLFSASESVRYRSRPESFLAPFAIDTGVIDAAHAGVVNLEAAFVKGGISGQFEYFHANVGGGGADTVHFPGGYLQLNGFITGESRPYDFKNGVFGQVLPLRRFSIGEQTWGAWELGGRYSYTNLDDGAVRGGRMHSLSGGLSWYWNRYLRTQFDYVHSLIDGGALDGRLNTFQMRFQLVI